MLLKERILLLVDALPDHASGFDETPEDAIFLPFFLSLGPCSLNDHGKRITPSSTNKSSGVKPRVEREGLDHRCHLPP